MVKTKVSAPGKVLLTGGYLILDQNYSGIVISVDSRFYVEIEPSAEEKFKVNVVSKQFIDGNWTYYLKDQSIQSCTGENKFIQTTLNLVFNYLGKVDFNTLNVYISADNDFYSQVDYLSSQNQVVSISSLKSVPKFNPTNKKIKDALKTGLGSSAAMVTSLVAALLLHFNVVSEKLRPQDLLQIEQLAQCIIFINKGCHCVSQGKIGSGFDISAACFGSQIYSRFNPDLLLNIDGRSIKKIVDATWDSKKLPFKLPPGVRILLGEIRKGSNTPKMVSKLLEWKATNPKKCLEIWDSILSFQSDIIKNVEKLTELHSINPLAYFENLAQLECLEFNSTMDVQNDMSLLLCEIHAAFKRIRKSMKIMGELAGVDIEPDQQTDLLDNCQKLGGVLMAGVPGAGGFDAIFCIVLGPQSRENVLKYWETLDGDCIPLLASSEANGLQLEN